MYLLTTSRNGVAALEIQRQIGTTYKTAWRMRCVTDREFVLLAQVLSVPLDGLLP